MAVLIIAGVTVFLLSTSVVANNKTQEDAEEITGFYTPSLKAPYPDITFTTPPDIPLMRENAPYERDDGGSADYGAPARDYGPPASDYGPPAREYSPLAREYGPPASDYGPPTREYGSPAREYGVPAREYGAPARDYGPPARDYGPPTREYSAPFRSSNQRYPPYPARDIPPVAEYVPPSGFGMSPPGSFPSSGAFPPTGGFPPREAFPPPEVFPPTGGFPPTGAFPPPGVSYPYEVSKADLHSRLYVLFEPLAVLVVGATIFVGIRHYVLPYLIYWARSLEEEEELLLEEERSLDDVTTLNILKVITKGVCLSRISCQLGMAARNYTIKDLAISAIEEEKNPPRLAVIFRDTALGRVQSCQPYFCRRKQLPTSTAAPEAKHWRRKRNTSLTVISRA